MQISACRRGRPPRRGRRAADRAEQHGAGQPQDAERAAVGLHRRFSDGLEFDGHEIPFRTDASAHAATWSRRMGQTAVVTLRKAACQTASQLGADRRAGRLERSTICGGSSHRAGRRQGIEPVAFYGRCSTEATGSGDVAGLAVGNARKFVGAARRAGGHQVLRHRAVAVGAVGAARARGNAAISYSRPAGRCAGSSDVVGAPSRNLRRQPPPWGKR